MWISQLGEDQDTLISDSRRMACCRYVARRAPVVGRSSAGSAETLVMAVPEGLSAEHHRDLAGRERRPVVRTVLLGVLCSVLVLGLLNIFGQVRSVDVAETAAAGFEVDAPSKLRGGLFFQARFKVDAVADLQNAIVVLHPDWLEDITLNTIEPAPVGEASRDGWIAFELGRVPAGDRYILYLQFQVNPTAVGVRSQDVELYDGERRLASFDRTLLIWP